MCVCVRVRVWVCVFMHACVCRPDLSVLEFDAHGVGLVLQTLDLRTDTAEVALKLTQHLLHILHMSLFIHACTCVGVCICTHM